MSLADDRGADLLSVGDSAQLFVDARPWTVRRIADQQVRVAVLEQVERGNLILERRVRVDVPRRHRHAITRELARQSADPVADFGGRARAIRVERRPEPQRPRPAHRHGQLTPQSPWRLVNPDSLTASSLPVLRFSCLLATRLRIELGSGR
ncbi:hypothetical protein [Jiangella alkaliphila]|uniref:hypothetical protein n=1 Tax=Jiangella alkaliphila TaxID=419479 RepID=UPI00128E65EB|nr:hypothetical protein [Jiangella alkaliphila]